MTQAELDFLNRAAVYVAAGMDPESAMRRVLEDDARILSVIMDRARSDYVPTPCEAGRAHKGPDRPGDVLAAELSRSVYDRIRKA